MSRVLTGATVVRTGKIACAFESAETWLRARTEWFVWAIVLLAFYVRFQTASGSYLNADEALIMYAPLQQGLRNVYEAGLACPYGPFLNFILHAMAFFGSSELYFRMIAVLPGALLCYVAYRWMEYLFGKAAGVAAACILGFSTVLVNLAAEVRFYTMQMFWMVCSLYCLERAFGERSRKWMRLFGATLLIAVLTQYTSLLYAAAIGIYALLRIMRQELPLRLIIEWVLAQVAAVAVCVLAYVTHLHRFRGGRSEVLARDVWLRGSYYHPESQSMWTFLRQATESLFNYVFGNSALCLWAIGAFFLGIAVIFLGKAGVHGNRKLPALLLILPLVVASATAIVRFFPYGGSRHDAFLSVFVAAGVAVAISFLARQNVIIVLLAALVLVPQWRAAAQHHFLDILPAYNRLDQIRAALDYLSKRTPRPRVLVTDQSVGADVNYYVCHSKWDPHWYVTPDLFTYPCGDYRILEIEEWLSDEATLVAGFSRARELAPNDFPDPAWIFASSDNMRISGSMSDESGGLFGRLYLRPVPLRPFLPSKK